MKGATALIKTLENLGITTIFGYPGGANLPIYDALHASTQIEHVLARHEQGAALMADGYARVAGKPGVCLATSGPGATNLVTGLANAHQDSVPMLAITGQIPLHFVGTDAFQEVDCFNVTMHVTKHNELVTDPNDIVPAARSAYRVADTGRKGPVLLDFPQDVVNAEGDYDLNADREMRGYRPTLKGHVGQVRKLVKALRAAERPLVLMGGGVVSARAEKALTEFLRSTNIPAVRTLMGKGILNERDPLYIGMAGTHGSVEGNKAVKNADFVLALGTRFGDRTTLKKPANFASQAKIAHVDVDPAEIGKNVPVDIPIVGDVRTVLEDALKLLSEKPLENEKPWHQTNNLKTILYNGDNATTIELVLNRLSQIDERIYITTDVGRHQMWATHCCLNPKHLPFLTSGGLGTMGYGLPAAIGAWYHGRDRPVVNVSGDGSFLMNMQEFTLAVEMNIPVVVVLINDYRLGMIRELQTSTYGKRLIANEFNRHTDFAKLAEAMGGVGVRVCDEAQILPALKKAIDGGRPTIIDFDIEKLAESQNKRLPFENAA